MIIKNRKTKSMVATYLLAVAMIGASIMLVAVLESQTVHSIAGKFTSHENAMFVMDGKEVTSGDWLKSLGPLTIKNIKFTNGESAVNIYGSKGTFGVVSISNLSK